MFKPEDKQLKEMKQTHDNVSMPDNIDSYIHAGMAKAKKKRKVTKSLRISTLAASILLATLFTSAQLSPAFANYLKTVPGINILVDLLGGADKGIHEAVTNDYIQEIGVSHTIGDQTFTVDHIIFDRSRMIIFYTFNIGEEDDSEERRLNIRPNILNAGGEDLPVGTSWGTWTGEGKEKKGRIEVSYLDPSDLPDNVTVQVQLEEYDRETHDYIVNEEKVFAVSFIPNKEKFFQMEENIELNQPVSIDGFNFTVDSAVIYPTQIAVHFSELDQNDYKLLSFQDFRLVDETGEEWNHIKGFGSGEKTYTMYFESNFFKNRKSLFLKGSTITALHKKDVMVAIDVKEQKLLKAPDDRLTFDGMEPSHFKGDEQMSLQFSLMLNDDDPNPSYFSFYGHLMNEDGSYKLDEHGNRRDYVGSQSTGHSDRIDGNDIAYASIDIDNTILENEEIIYLKLSNYPNFFTSPFSITIK